MYYSFYLQIFNSLFKIPRAAISAANLWNRHAFSRLTASNRIKKRSIKTFYFNLSHVIFLTNKFLVKICPKLFLFLSIVNTLIVYFSNKFRSSRTIFFSEIIIRRLILRVGTPASGILGFWIFLCHQYAISRTSVALSPC